MISGFSNTLRIDCVIKLCKKFNTETWKAIREMSEKVQEIVNAAFQYILFFIFEVWQVVKYFIRRLYVWHIFSVRNRWYLSRNGNYYNPILEATVYPWSPGWNIARFGIHYQGYTSKIHAQESAFKMWMKERFHKNNSTSFLEH